MTGVVAHELKQQKPFASPEQEVLLGLRMAAARVVEPWARFLRTTAQLTTHQYNVLRILRGSHPARLACSDIAERMIERDPDITRLVDRLERRGLVKRSRSRQDRRVVEVGITDKGLVLVRGLDAPRPADAESAARTSGRRASGAAPEPAGGRDLGLGHVSLIRGALVSPILVITTYC